MIREPEDLPENSIVGLLRVTVVRQHLRVKKLGAALHGHMSFRRAFCFVGKGEDVHGF